LDASNAVCSECACAADYSASDVAHTASLMLSSIFIACSSPHGYNTHLNSSNALCLF